MFKIESYITPILLSYVDKYVRDFKPADAQVSLWGGGVALHNLVLKADVLQQEVALPFTLVSGRIHELLIQVPWTKIMSEPIIVTIDTIECILSLNPPVSPDGAQPPESPTRKTQVVEAPPGYMQALVRRIVSNIALRVHHLIVKYVQDDIVMSLNVKHLSVDSAGVNWEPIFADIDPSHPVIRRLVRLDDLTLCLDRTDADGKIRFYQEPLLYRCQLELKVLTKLISANTRRASSLNVHVSSSKLAWGVTNEQLTLLIRLMRERPVVEDKQPPPAPKNSTVQPTPLRTTSANSSEPVRLESWSEWAWSWLPTWAERGEEPPAPPAPAPIYLSAYFDNVAVVFKMMELEGSRKRARGILELSAIHAAVKSSMCSPTILRVRFGARDILLRSHGKCVCGHFDIAAADDNATIYFSKIGAEENEEWTWPVENMDEEKVEIAEAVDEEYKHSAEGVESQHQRTEGPEETEAAETSRTETTNLQEYTESKTEEREELWNKMSPLIYFEYLHERTPPNAYTNPYENPPLIFEYSDWVENCSLKVQLQPVELRVCMELIHRISAVRSVFQDLPAVPDPELLMRTLTVEECEALLDNLPQRRFSFEAKNSRVRVCPWDHSLNEKPQQAPPIVLDFEIPKANVIVNAPLYPHRVCSAACQMPDDTSPLWQGALLHLSAALSSIQAKITSPIDACARPCARLDLRFVTHTLLNKEFFSRKESVVFSYSLKIREANLCGSAARLQAAWQVPMSLIKGSTSALLRHTTLPKDALSDEDLVAIDVTLEELTLRGYLTRNVNTHIVVLQAVKATALHAQSGEEVKQAWLFSGPDAPTTTPYLRVAAQWCAQKHSNSLDYLGVWSEPTAISVDPLFIAWLAYKPQVRQQESNIQMSSSTSRTSQYFTRRRVTPPSSSGRGVSQRSGSGAELVHATRRSLGSSSEPGEKNVPKDPSPQVQAPIRWWDGDFLLKLHERLRHMLVNVEGGLILVYVTMSTASAVDCATIRDAMERHAEQQRVLAISLGRLSAHSNSANRHLWHEVRHDGPTFLSPKVDEKEESDSFPWKMRLSDVSCYTLEVQVGPDKSGKEKSLGGLRSHLKTVLIATPRTVLELVTTTITFSVVTKQLQITKMKKSDHRKSTSTAGTQDKTKYFTMGTEFKPSTLKEFVRGPAGRRGKKSSPTLEQTVESKETEKTPQFVTTSGPVVSLGFHLHADTPPIIVRLDHDQVHMVSGAVHCFKHIVTLLQRSPLTMTHSNYSMGGSNKSLIRSVSEIEEIQSQSEDTPSENQSELITIFDTQQTHELKLKTFFWCQWVVSRATLVMATQQVKLAFDVDDIISTVDLQTHYNQLKIKLASASLRHYERTSDEEWTAGVLGGRVLEAREPTNAKEESHFLAVTITQAQISNLPASWKEELHPKLLQQKSSTDTMWEIYATLAPLEAVIQRTVWENIMSLMNELAPRSYCPLEAEAMQSTSSTWQWPYCYITAGGLRLLITAEQDDKEKDDTVLFLIGKVAVNPHPDNPIIRRAVNSAVESAWSTTGQYEGRQYEVVIKKVAVQSARFKQLVHHESNETNMLKGTGGENPALKWSLLQESPVITPILHGVDVGCVLAPPLYISGILVNGPAVELNLLSDCAVELSVDQLCLMTKIVTDILRTQRHERCIQFDEEKRGVCPYATLLLRHNCVDEIIIQTSDVTLTDVNVTEVSKSAMGRSLAADSGVDTVTSHSTTFKSSRFADPATATKKGMSVVFMEELEEASEYLEVFITIGVVELSLYVVDDGSSEVMALRAPSSAQEITGRDLVEEKVVEELKDCNQDNKSQDSQGASKSITDTARNTDIGKAKMELLNILPQARRSEGNLPLIHVSLHQPNIYYWKKKDQKSLQVSLFNAWVGFGAGQIDNVWHESLFSTTKGVPDPVTDIRPALATMKLVAPSGHSGNAASRGNIRLDIERPVSLEVSEDRLRRLKGIYGLIQKKISLPYDNQEMDVADLPCLYKVRRSMIYQSIDSVTIQTSQIGICGTEGTFGVDSASLQIAAGARPERLLARSLLSALLIAGGPPGDRRHVILQPMMIGMELEANWESWRRSEGGISAREPTVRFNIDADNVTIDLRPADLKTLSSIQQTMNDIWGITESTPVPKSSSETIFRQHDTFTAHIPYCDTEHHSSGTSVDSADITDHYYKDDLRSGAFKIVSGGQLPMAYQVMLHGNAVSWRYPHPRAITRIIAFPLPGVNTEVECVLEMFSVTMQKWEPHTYFKLPVGEPRELKLYVAPPDVVFAVMWRFRVCAASEQSTRPPYEFNSLRFAPRADPLVTDPQMESEHIKSTREVTAEQLSGVLRVDSYFAPKLLPRLLCGLRIASLELYAHNALPCLSSQATELEGYYVSRPLMRSHRVLSVSARDTCVRALLGSTAGTSLLFNLYLKSDVVDCTTGTMEKLIDETCIQGGVSVPGNSMEQARMRLRIDIIRVTLNVPRIRTLHTLTVDWQTALNQYLESSYHRQSPCNTNVLDEGIRTKRELVQITSAALEGRVSLWIHNSCASSLRVGQEGTDEVVPLGPGARMNYRWRNPNMPKKLRFALASPSSDWHWSNSTPFTPGTYRVRLHDLQPVSGTPGAGVFLHVRVRREGACRLMSITGRLVLADMLRTPLLYKVRARCPETNQWRTVCSGELAPESVGRSVVCAAECEMILKIKLPRHDTGWSGDIPLKECPKENVPWLVKVPSEGDLPYMSVWCRVIRARSDGRVLATVWPLYVLRSHLPLDTDVLVNTETELPSSELTSQQHPTLIQSAPGRGVTTHLLVPGTTSARHNLSFQYRDIECPVTREAIPLHYGVTDTSVFDKRAPVSTVEEVITEILKWLEHSRHNAKSSWPYSVVAKHWPLPWKPALLQPRCDVTIRYQPIHAGGGCCLETQLCPVVLLCNAASFTLTLRAHDAAPLCKLESGTAISPPSAVLKKPFFLSVEMGRETFVSGQLEVWNEDPGRYGTPPPGRVALSHCAEFAIHCNQKVALLTLHYEIKEEINVLGITSTFVLVNALHTELLVSAIVVPEEVDKDVVLRPKTFKFVQPTKDRCDYGIPLCRFWVHGRWRGGDPSELRAYLCIALPDGAYPAHVPVPIRLGTAPVRRAIALTDVDKNSMAVVVTQIKHEGRWLVTVAEDPCPQFVVYNRTRRALAVAQPTEMDQEPSTSSIVITPECPGTKWYCVVEPNTMIHYSSPAYCARYPPPPNTPITSCLPFLTFAQTKEDERPEWSPPVAVAGGEQLLQLVGRETIKLRVHPYPHSTLIELQDVDQHDISASDIRKRLLGSLVSQESIKIEPDKREVLSNSCKLERVDADDRLLNKSVIRTTSVKLLNRIPSLEIQPSGETLTPIVITKLESSKQRTKVETMTKGQPDLTTEYRASKISVESDESKNHNRQVPEYKLPSSLTLASAQVASSENSYTFHDIHGPEWGDDSSTSWSLFDRFRCVVTGFVVEMASAADMKPLLALYLDRVALLVQFDSRGIKTMLAIADLQIDNLQYETGQFDFAVVASTRSEPSTSDPWPSVWNMFADTDAFATNHENARLKLRTRHDKWVVLDKKFSELTELEIHLGPLALYIEDAYVTALVELSREVYPPRDVNEMSTLMAETYSLQHPVRLRLLLIHPLDLTLTLHTAVRMYIALDQSPLRLSAFKLQDMMTSPERLTHALTVHYLSAAILGAGWVVGGLELLGAPGALAARVGGATGGVRGVASAAAAALLRSLSACAGSLARNLDLLAGDEEHARRAAAARRRPPESFLEGLVAGITNFAINILGAVGGLAHHPLVGVAVGETDSSAAALRRSLVGALTKPLSATADLVAYAGHGLLRQTGWDPVPQPRSTVSQSDTNQSGGWRRDCVRWTFRLSELTAFAGYEVLLDNAPLQLLLTHKFLVVAEPETERIIEMIDFRYCSLSPYQGAVIELSVTQKRKTAVLENDDDNEYQISSAAMARVARYTGAEGGPGGEARTLYLLPTTGRAHSLHAALAAAVHNNTDTHFTLM